MSKRKVKPVIMWATAKYNGQPDTTMFSPVKIVEEDVKCVVLWESDYRELKRLAKAAKKGVGRPADVPPLQDWTLPFRAEAADGTWWVVLSAKNVDLWMGKSESTAKAIAHALNAVYGKEKQ